jgi:ribosomal protein L11 methyltransferase
MAAVALGAAHAVGFDLDPIAIREARAWTTQNRLADRVSLFTGGIDALRAPPFDWVFANLLRSEMLPIAPRIAASVGPEGGLLLSGLLEADGPPIYEAFARLGLERRAERSRLDPSGDRWIAPWLTRVH